ncbi:MULTISPECIES: helix-turn-helix domain-containing protein [Bradyrhizobium]|uniref:helix-turn-helix domain-containing protein n=1 Tax=Bradyrhizobium TaxID=374 RepID=UPI00351650A6
MDSNLYRLFGDRVRELRETRSVTQEELARRVQLSRASITNIEKGRQRVLLHQLIEIADALDAKPSELMPSPQSQSDPTMRQDVARVVEMLKSEKSRSDK